MCVNNVFKESLSHHLINNLSESFLVQDSISFILKLSSGTPYTSIHVHVTTLFL